MQYLLMFPAMVSALMFWIFVAITLYVGAADNSIVTYTNLCTTVV